MRYCYSDVYVLTNNVKISVHDLVIERVEAPTQSHTEFTTHWAPSYTERPVRFRINNRYFGKEQLLPHHRHTFKLPTMGGYQVYERAGWDDENCWWVYEFDGEVLNSDSFPGGSVYDS